MRDFGPRYEFDPVRALYPTLPLTVLAEVLKVHPRQVHRWIECGLTHQAADRAACAVGWLPWMLWPDWLNQETSRHWRPQLQTSA